MTNVDSKILNRVRKMMRLAQDAGASEGERDNAMRMVQATLAKYNLDIGQVDATQDTAEEKRGKHSAEFLGKPWCLQIAAAIGRLYFCHYYYSTLGGNKGPTQKAKHTFVGRTSNVVTAQEMAEFVVTSVNREAQRYQRSIYGSYSDYRAFAQGAAERIRQRVHTLIEEASTKGVATTEEPGTALVLASLYKREIDANKGWLEAQGVKLSSGRSQSYAESSHARAAGRQYGSSVSLHRQVGSVGQKRIK